MPDSIIDRLLQLEQRTAALSQELAAMNAAHAALAQSHESLENAHSELKDNVKTHTKQLKFTTAAHNSTNTARVRYEGLWGTWQGPYWIPDGHYIVGFKVRFEPSQGSGDDTALNGIEFICKPYPQP
jgi:hypothetical protein